MGLFDSLIDSIDNALNVGVDLLEFETPDRRRVARLLADGLTVAAVAGIVGWAISDVEDVAGEL